MVVLVANDGNKVPFLAAATPKAIERGVKAGQLVGLVGQYCEGRGGGKPDMAQGSGTNIDGASEAFAAVADELKKL